MLELHSVLCKAKRWAVEAGKIQVERFGRKELCVHTKSTRDDLVTEVDELCEKYITEAIGSSFPGHAILAEEGGEAGTETGARSNYQWVVDPLDGTTNYSQGIPIFAVSIALRHRDRTVLGIVYQPLLGEMFSAVKGGGAYLNDSPISVAEKELLKESVLATGFPYDKSTHEENNVKYFAHFLPRIRGIRRLGAASYDLASVAAGRFDGFWELKLSPWDVEAGILLVQEAGGRVVFLEGKRPLSLAAGNGIICAKIAEEIKKADGGGRANLRL